MPWGGSVVSLLFHLCCHRVSHTHIAMYIIIFFLFCFFPDNFFTIFFVDYECNAKNKKYKTKRKRRNNLSLSSVQSEQRRTWSIFHQSVDVVLGAVLRRGHFENVGHALQRLLRVPIRHHLVGRDAHAKPQQTKDVKNKASENESKPNVFHLQDGEVLEDAVHHVLLGQVFELVDEIDHVLAHGRAMDAINETAVLETRVLRFHLFHDLLTE